MKLTLVDDSAWALNWSNCANRNITDEEVRTEQLQQPQIEEAIESIVGDSFSSGFDWLVEHFDPPPFVFSLILQNSLLWRRDLIEQIRDRVTRQASEWALNLVLVDAIHNGVWTSGEGMASLFLSQQLGLLCKQPGYDRLPDDLKEWFSELADNREDSR